MTRGVKDAFEVVSEVLCKITGGIRYLFRFP